MRRLALAALFSLCLPALVIAQGTPEMEVGVDTPGDTPYADRIQYDSQGYLYMQTFDDGDNDTRTFMVAAYGYHWETGSAAWALFKVNAVTQEIVAVYDQGADPRPRPNQPHVCSPNSWDGAKCCDPYALGRVLQDRFMRSMRDAVLSGAAGWWAGGPVGALGGFTVVGTVAVMWDMGSLVYHCGGG